MNAHAVLHIVVIQAVSFLCTIQWTEMKHIVGKSVRLRETSSTTLNSSFAYTRQRRGPRQDPCYNDPPLTVKTLTFITNCTSLIYNNVEY